MGVPINQALYGYMVVMQVEAAVQQQRRVSYNPSTEDIKYFKYFDHPQDVLKVAVSLKENERIASIFAVSEHGVTFPKTIVFDGGKFVLADKETEEN